jgi:hypothetical protein
MDDRETDMPLPLAARELRLSGEQCRRRVLTGELEGDLRAGRWYVTAESVARLKRARAARRDATPSAA